MQRSRKALLQRRAAFSWVGVLSKKQLYLKASLLFLSWIIMFVLVSMINHGDGYQDVVEVVIDESNLHTTPPETFSDLKSDDSLAITEAASSSDMKGTPVSASHTFKQTQEAHIEDDVESSSSGVKLAAKEIPDMDVKNDVVAASQKIGRIPRASPPGIDEYKSKAFTTKERSMSGQTGTVVHRMEPSGIEYNYASAAKGAKVLAFNKEAKGASNILDKDKDKYLRNPCSAEEKHVVIELSEETLVDSLQIANFEHYSSNLKEFELLSSLVYPTDSWVKLGNFTAQNAKHAQRFVLPEPNWARYLKLNLLSHHGSEFYCTLSVVEVYGVDAVERMLEDLISVENKKPDPEEHEQISVQDPNVGDDVCQELLTGAGYESKDEGLKTKPEAAKASVANQVENRPSQVGRVPGDTVLKILLQKVQSLDANFSILERYLDELNSRYRLIFKELDDDIAKKDALLEKVKLEIGDLLKAREMLANEIGDLFSWKVEISSQLTHLIKERALLRSEIEAVRVQQTDMENKGILVILISFIFACVAVSKFFIDMLILVCRFQDSEKFCRISGWLLLLLSCSIAIFILV